MEIRTETGRVFAADNEGNPLAQVTFPEIRDGVVEIDHTFVDESLRGQGIAGKMMKIAADSLRAQGKKAVLTCSYAVKWFGNHPEYGDIVVKKTD